MQRIVATSAAALLLVGCSQKAPFADLADGDCTGSQAELVNKHISNQIDALADKDWDLAYTFASDNFQSNVSVDDFILVINAQYPMLVENKGYDFSDCSIADSAITQEVGVTSGDRVYSITYTLTVNDSDLGVESAVVSKVTAQLGV
jgi:hypothetical protein